ncbi:MAG TPA: YegP family protein, partial [Kofleriaceae bacterium]|nr:YegP family protein [Kofleriaceae bacterium]
MRNLHSLIAAFVLSTSALVAGCAVQADDTSDTDDAASAPGSFDLWQADDGQWHFHLVAGNGNTLLTSEAYTDRTGAINGVLSVEANGIENAKYQVVAAANGYLLHLVAGNGEVISSTQVYSTKSNATRAITSCVNAVTSYDTKFRNKTTGARVAVVLGDSGQWHFSVFAKNGQNVLSSESYASQAAAYNGAL